MVGPEYNPREERRWKERTEKKKELRLIKNQVTTVFFSFVLIHLYHRDTV